MILQQFPDLYWLKQKIAQRFLQPLSSNAIPAAGAGFPNVIINAVTRETYRPDIAGPISLFMNVKGRSHCTVEGRKVAIGEDTFFVTNRFQPYTLEIESRQPVETFNIHIGEAFSEGVLSALLTPADAILDNGLQQKSVHVNFHNQLHRKEAPLMGLVEQLKTLQAAPAFNQPLYEDYMHRLLLLLLQQHRQVVQQINKMPALKPATRVALYKHLALALDYMHDSPSETLDVNVLATTACLSKFHFIRLFKQTYGVSPYQYWQALRLSKAAEMLRHTKQPVHHIAATLGFENSNSFSRLFLQRTGQYPTQYRLAVN